MRRYDGLDVLLWVFVVVLALMQLVLLMRALQPDESIDQCIARCVRR